MFVWSTRRKTGMIFIPLGRRREQQNCTSTFHHHHHHQHHHHNHHPSSVLPTSRSDWADTCLSCRSTTRAASTMEQQEERYLYPFLVPPDMALICKSPVDGKFYCQVPGCTGVANSKTRAQAHLKKAHSDKVGHLRGGNTICNYLRHCCCY